MTSAKERVIEEIAKEWQNLEGLLAQVVPERMEEAGVVESWSMKDLIGHITTWEDKAVDRIRKYLPDRDLEMLKWPDVDAFNERTVASKKAVPLAELRSALGRTHQEMVRIFSGLDEEIFDRPEVEERIRIDTFAHYREHAEAIKSWLSVD